MQPLLQEPFIPNANAILKQNAPKQRVQRSSSLVHLFHNPSMPQCP